MSMMLTITCSSLLNIIHVQYLVSLIYLVLGISGRPYSKNENWHLKNIVCEERWR